VNRITSFVLASILVSLGSGPVAAEEVGTAPAERISVGAAMRAITVDAASIMGWEEEIGSIRAGKRADFTVLEQDRYAVDPVALKDVPVWGTIFEGELAPVVQAGSPARRDE